MEGLWQTTDLQTWGKCPLARHTPSSIGSCSVNVNFRTQGVMYLGSVSEDNHADNPGDGGPPYYCIDWQHTLPAWPGGLLH